MKSKILALAILLMSPSQIAVQQYPGEVEWARQNWSKYVKSQAFVEFNLWDNTRVDYLGEDIAWEIDWCEKWAEAIGQSKYYSIVSGKKPGIILLVKEDHKTASANYIYRCQTVCAKDDIVLSIEIVRPL